MSTDNKTLADVQPGGRVRLGDHDEKPPQELPDLIVTRGDGIPLPDQAAGIEEFKRQCLRRIEAEYPHLSAQPSPADTGIPTSPSPGGQGGLNYERMFVDACAALAEVSRELGCDPEQGGAEPILAAIAELRAALAARQPVTMDDALAAGDGTLHGAIDHWQERALRAEAELAARQPVYVQGCDELRARTESERAAYMEGLEEGKKIAARQPVESEENVAADTYWTLAEMIEPHVQREGINPDGALPASVHDSVAILLEHWLRTRQPVGVDEATHRALDEIIDQRDRCEKVADELADQIARITGVDIGEHSNANCPWQNAIEAAEEYKPAQAVDLDAVREALQAAEGLATICASVDGYSREEVAASGRAMKQQFSDALAKIDSQAVGNG